MPLSRILLIATTVLLHATEAVADTSLTILNLTVPGMVRVSTEVPDHIQELPAQLIYEQSTAVFVPAASFQLRIEHTGGAFPPLVCTGRIADGESRLLVLTAVTERDALVGRCELLTRTGREQARRSDQVSMEFHHLAYGGGTGWFGVYAAGSVYISPCTPVVQTGSLSPGSRAVLQRPPSHVDLAFARACQPPSVDVPAVQERIAMSSGHRYLVMLVRDSQHGASAVRLFVLTEVE
jgi:hypothetical protein